MDNNPNQKSLIKSKILILLPDGVGLKNFVFSNFPNKLKKLDLQSIYWNATPFPLLKIGYNEIKLSGKPDFRSDIFKKVRKIIEINESVNVSRNNIFNNYLFKSKSNNLKQLLKKIYQNIIFNLYKKNLKGIRDKIKKLEKNTAYFNKCLNQLDQSIQVLLVTNQRPINAVAPVEAAKELGIPTVNFIFSWDNLPKATMVVESDYYLVWSKYMKEELLYYYPYVDKEKVYEVGTPQFEIHYDADYLMPKNDFFKKYDLDHDKDYICYSGDDITTSPHDPEYLRDLANSVKRINSTNRWNKKLGIIFRPCPVDFSSRFDEVLEDFNDIIHLIRPAWKSYGGSWNKVMPSYEDQVLLANTVRHTKMVVNVGSSMVFDYAAQNKPCAYINYNPKVEPLKKDIYKIYQYIHFESMPAKNAVIWLNSKEELEAKILEGLNTPEPYVQQAQKWFEVINQHPPDQASRRIVDAINDIIEKQ